MKHTLRALSVAAIFVTTFLVSLVSAEENEGGELGWDAQTIDNHASLVGHASRSVVSESDSQDLSSNSSSGEVRAQYEDNSTWEEQPHRGCSTEKDDNGLAKYACHRKQLRRLSQPEQPAAGGGPQTVTITTRQAATLIASGSGITRQPPGAKVVISKAFIVYTDPSPHYQTTTILGTTVEIEFTPISYTWNWGDGTTTTTTDPGAPYPNQTVTHHYKHTAQDVTTTLTTTWTTRYRPQGDTDWRTIDGTITTNETSTPYDLVRITSYLTDDAEQAQGH